MTIRDFETHLKFVLSDHDRGTFTEAMDKLFKHKVLHALEIHK